MSIFAARERLASGSSPSGGLTSTETTNLPARDLRRELLVCGGRRRRRHARRADRRPRWRVDASIDDVVVGRRLPRCARRASMRAAPAIALDVLGRGAAAAADEPHAELEHAAREHAEVLGRGDVDEAAVDAARQAGVGLRAHRQRRAATQLLDAPRTRPAGRRSS